MAYHCYTIPYASYTGYKNVLKTEASRATFGRCDICRYIGICVCLVATEFSLYRNVDVDFVYCILCISLYTVHTLYIVIP